MNKILNKIYIDLYRSNNPVKRWLASKVWDLIWDLWSKKRVINIWD